MSGLCIMAGKLLAAIPISVFTLATTDPVDRSRQEVEWKIVGMRLVSNPEATPQAQRDSRSNMAMSMKLSGQGPKKPQSLPQMMITYAPEAAQVELCLDDRCRPLGTLLPGIEPYAVIELRVCPDEK